MLCIIVGFSWGLAEAIIFTLLDILVGLLHSNLRWHWAKSTEKYKHIAWVSRDLWAERAVPSHQAASVDPDLWLESCPLLHWHAAGAVRQSRWPTRVAFVFWLHVQLLQSPASRATLPVTQLIGAAAVGIRWWGQQGLATCPTDSLPGQHTSLWSPPLLLGEPLAGARGEQAREREGQAAQATGEWGGSPSLTWQHVGGANNAWACLHMPLPHQAAPKLKLSLAWVLKIGLI